MTIRLKTLLVLLVCGIILKTTIFGATATETLPKGVWMIDVKHQSTEFTKVGQVEDGEYKFVSADNFKTGQLLSTSLPQAMTGLYLASAITQDYFDSGETKVAEVYTLDETHLNLAYGVTDKFTLSLKIPYVKKVLTYSDEYIDAFEEMEADIESGDLNTAILQSQGIPISSADDLPVPPKRARGQGIGDITLGAKYRFIPNWAIGLTYQGGFLKTGSGPLELKDREDDEEQLSTGFMADFITLALFHDKTIGKHIVSFTTSYEHSSRGYENSLDNVYATDRGDTFVFKIDSDFYLTEKFMLEPSLAYIQTGYDQVQDSDTGEWDKINGSESATTFGSLKLVYKPVIFLDAYIQYDAVLSQHLAKGNYDFPGRLYTDSVLTFGSTLYLK